MTLRSQTKAAALVYNAVINPLLVRHEAKIDEQIDVAHGLAQQWLARANEVLQPAAVATKSSPPATAPTKAADAARSPSKTTRKDAGDPRPDSPEPESSPKSKPKRAPKVD